MKPKTKGRNSPEVLVDGDGPVVERSTAEGEADEAGAETPDEEPGDALPVAGEREQDLTGLVTEEDLEDGGQRSWKKWVGMFWVKARVMEIDDKMTKWEVIGIDWQ